MRRIFITNGSAGSGKDTFAELLSKYISVYKYSSIDLVKEMFETVGISKDIKTEKKRKLWSDGKDLLTEYDDIPFKDVSSVVNDFNRGLIDADVLFIDIREPDEIKRAVEEYNAKTILIRNPRIEHIKSNHADANVEQYEYDYIIENGGTLNDLDAIASSFAFDITMWGDKIFETERGEASLIYGKGEKEDV